MGCHSMGSIMMSYFLNNQTQAWKDKYIRSLISVAGVWGGTARAVKVFAVGDNLDSWFLNEKNLLWERTNPSLAWLMPAEEFWSDDEVLVQTENKNFTRTNIGDYFTALGEPNMASMVQDTRVLLTGFLAPNVEVFCSHGSKVDTTETVVYPKGSFPSAKPKKVVDDNISTLRIWPWPSAPSLIKGDGDGTVNIRSLEGCLKWRKKQTQPVHHQVFEKVNHLDMLRTEEPTQNVADIIASLNKELADNKENNRKHALHKERDNEKVEEETEHHAIKDVGEKKEIHADNEFNHDNVHPIIEVL